MIATCDVTTTELSPGDQFIIMASDGFWDLFSNEEAADLAMNALRTHQVEPEHLAQFLAQSSYDLGSLDNITVLVIYLGTGAIGRTPSQTVPNSPTRPPESPSAHADCDSVPVTSSSSSFSCSSTISVPSSPSYDCHASHPGAATVSL